MFLHDFSDVPLFIGRCSNDFKKKSSSLFNKAAFGEDDH
jgi:hypothetical protein